MKRTPLRRKTPLRKKSKTTLAKLKAELWQLCREIIFKRHGNNCYTCPARSLTGSNRQCGHYISSSVCSAELRFDLDNLRPQCAGCNIWKSGNWIAFAEHLERDGIDTNALIKRNNKTKGLKYSELWYTNKIAVYELIAASLSPAIP